MAAETESEGAPRLCGAEWLDRPETRAVFSAIEAGGFAARAVGGAVRNALMGLPVKDVDIATPARPEEVKGLAEAAGLKAVPTGIEHGTITVIAGHIPYEVTTLRRDVETFGRHAKVTFTSDWTEDARRRDFTINALYCSADGTVHDPLGGWSDLVKRRVRFIDDARQRIREDYLRILRFFRFTAEYGNGTPDPEGLAAAIEERGGLTLLSAERIRAELLRLLEAREAARALTAMDDAGILRLLVGKPPDMRLFHRIVDIERSLGCAPSPLLRLAALAVTEPGDADRLKERLRLSTFEAEVLAHAALQDLALDPSAPKLDAKAFLYRHGPAAFTTATLIAWAHSDDSAEDAGRRDRLELPQRWQAPELPIRGADVLALGIPPGPEVGRIVARFEAWWIAQGFPVDPVGAHAELARIAAMR